MVALKEILRSSPASETSESCSTLNQFHGSTSAYVPPETIRGEGYTRCGDIWGLGIILFQMATLNTPFETVDAEAIIEEIKQGKHVDVGSEYSSDFKKLLDHIFKPEKEDRWTIDQILASPFV